MLGGAASGISALGAMVARDGRVCRLRITFDMMDISRQIGMAPKAGSRLEKATAATQRLAVAATRCSL